MERVTGYAASKNGREIVTRLRGSSRGDPGGFEPMMNVPAGITTNGIRLGDQRYRESLRSNSRLRARTAG
jgi:hypothetical protein